MASASEESHSTWGMSAYWKRLFVLIIHIGFGKCGTTSLQRHVFSHLVEMNLIEKYNPVEIKSRLGLFRRGDRTQIQPLQKYFKDHREKKILVSLESLIGWNPAIWQERLEFNKMTFPEDTTILITVREPEGFLRSFYQQNFHGGHIVPPEHYLLSREDYDRACLTARSQIAEIFSVDDMNYRNIVSKYAATFRKVVVVPINRLNDLEFMKTLDLCPTSQEIAQLQQNIRSGGKENLAFSNTAMRISSMRESALNRLGLKTLSSSDHDYRKCFLISPKEPFQRSLPHRILRRFLAAAKVPRWRWLMNQVVDRFCPYTSYTLPAQIPRGIYFEDNKKFVDEILSKPQGIAVFEK